LQSRGGGEREREHGNNIEVYGEVKGPKGVIGRRRRKKV
jgi:hypothetical protein